MHFTDTAVRRSELMLAKCSYLTDTNNAISSFETKNLNTFTDVLFKKLISPFHSLRR